MGFITRQYCKHSREISKLPIPASEVEKHIFKIPSCIEGLNKAYGGYLYNSDAIVMEYAKDQMGKTLTLLCDAYNAMAQGFNVLWIDTEGGMLNIVAKWKDKLLERFKNIEPEKKAGELYIEPRDGWHNLHDYFGYNTIIQYTQKDQGKAGKLTLRVIEDSNDYPARQDVKNLNIKFVILDGVSQPNRNQISDEQQNNPVKSTCVALVLGRIRSLQKEFGVSAAITCQASWNPAEQTPDGKSNAGDVQARGTASANYTAKRIIYIDKRESAKLANYRRFWLKRIEGERELSHVVPVMIDDSGVHDSDIKIEELCTNAELSKLTNKPDPFDMKQYKVGLSGMGRLAENDGKS
jgi:hypothetical protein